MDRQIIYSGQVPQTTDLLNTNKQAMIALAKLCSDLFGTASLVSGLTCVPTSPASMSVNINPGQIYQLANVDGTAYSAVAADTTHSILKQGILLDAQSFALTAPGTVGYSQNYLIQATYLDNDINNTVLPYYNSANPTQAFNGPGGNGTSQPTTRAGQVSLQLVAGTAATTGSQTTPAVTTGYVGLWVITVANGQSTITSGNITQYAGAPILPSSLLASIQNGNLSYAVATGTANAHTIALTPALTARVDGMMIRYKAPAANTGAVTLNDGLGAVQVLGGNHAALQGSEYAPNGDAFVVWNSTVSGGSYILVDCTGGAVQVAPGTQSKHAATLGQVQSASANIATDTGTANTYVVAFSPALTSPPAFVPLWFSVKTANTGPSTLNATGTAYTLVGEAHAPLQGGELVANGQALVYWNPYLNSGGGQWVLVFCTGAASQLAGSSYGVTPPQFDTSTKLATMAALQSAIGSYSSATLITASVSLTAAWAGRVAALGGSSGYTVTLPPSSAFVNGAAITFVNTASVNQTISRASTDTITTNGNSLTSISLKQGDSVTLVLLGTIWYAFGTGTLNTSLSFATSSGSMILPNGRIRKWGSWTPNASVGAATAVTFPTAFPTSADSLVVCVGGQTSTTIQGAWWDGFTTTGFNGHSNQSSGGCYYIAEGF